MIRIEFTEQQVEDLSYERYLLCFTRLFIKPPSGRKRFNVLGALNAVMLEIITFTNK